MAWTISGTGFDKGATDGLLVVPPHPERMPGGITRAGSEL